MISYDEALNHIVSSRIDFGSEEIPIENAFGRILAEDIFADRDYPPFNRAMMDGYAVRAEDVLENKISEFHVAGEVFAGDGGSYNLMKGETLRIMTGAPVPDNADVVIKKEDAIPKDRAVSFNIQKINLYHNIACRGEDIQRHQLVINRNVQIDFRHLSLLASLGKEKMKVVRSPKVNILSTGNEVVPVRFSPEPWQIRDSNSYSITGFLKNYQIEPSTVKLAQDDLDNITSSVLSILDCDLLIISGGVSEGDADFVPTALKRCGVKEIFHKVKIKPGKPIWFGQHPNGSRIFALPGNPLPVQIACKIFIDPFLRSCFGLQSAKVICLPIGVERQKKIIFDEFFPVKIYGSQQPEIIPLSFNGSGDIMAVLNSSGVARHDAVAGDLKKGDVIEFYPWKDATWEA